MPPGAVLALGWAMRGAKPVYALLAVAAFVVALDRRSTRSTGEAAAALPARRSSLHHASAACWPACVPAAPLKLGIVAMAVIDFILVFGNQLQGPNATLNAAVPAPGLPQLQYLDVTYARMGYGDVFVAGVLGGVLAARAQTPGPRGAARVRRCAARGTCCSCTLNTLPATVPIARRDHRSWS